MEMASVYWKVVKPNKGGLKRHDSLFKPIPFDIHVAGNG
jgi:hypothetical protein